MKAYLSNYSDIEIVHEGVKTVIFRGKKADGVSSVIIKTLKANYPTLEEITRLRHEYKLLQALDLEGVVKVYSLENYNNGLALILEDFGWESLKQLMNGQKIPLRSFLSIAAQLAETLHQLHQKHIIHKDIKPQNILIDPETWQVKIIDFSIASRLSRETPTLNNIDLLEGTLAYISPEQTGRMNRSIDYRTDFYSLGVTFYEILTGELPFKTNDALELVHSHIAKEPVPPHELNPEIPLAVSLIVMKLMAKTAEDRYQSGLGLKADLEICLNQLLIHDSISDFTPGNLDKSGQFLIPQKLYGREIEVSTLLDAFERVRAGTAEMMLVSGYSGIGKTSIVNEVHKPIVRDRGYFIPGKFDQFKRNIPYAALIQAFQELMRQLLTESQEKIELWKEKLLAALGQNGQVIIDVIPEVEKIIGSQPSIPQLAATEAQNRFNGVFQQFIGVFAQKQHPLVLFLDDLQWADSASLKLIQLIMTDADSKYLLLIGAYRDNEVSPTHATIQTIEKIESSGVAVNNIILQPLNFGNVSQLVADTLVEDDTERSKPLAELVYNKTQGNPFFLTQLLQTLHAENLLQFDFGKGQWLWDIEKIQAIGITDFNVVELVARNIQKLPVGTQQVLKLAACIGHQFSLENLAIVNEKSLLTTADDLWEALQAGLVLPLSQAYKIPLVGEWASDEQLPISYKFLHDRVQQAAYSLILAEQKKATHLKIGRLLWQKTAKLALEENIFDIVNQLNIGVELITDAAEKEELAKLNLMAGKKAKAATAYDAAIRYLNVGLVLLPESCWENQYDLTRDIYVETVATEYLNTNFDRAKELSEVVLERAKTLLEKVNIYELIIPFYLSQNQMKEALDTALEVLKILGINLPKKPSKLTIAVELVRTKLTLRGKRIEDLAFLPQMTDPYNLAALRILMNLIPAAFLVTPALFPLIIFKMVNLSVKQGISPLSAYGYCFYGMLLSGLLGEIDSGYQFGNLALQLLDRLNAKELKAKVYYIFNYFIKHWKDDISETKDPLLEGFQSGLETGDLEYASYSLVTYSTNSFFRGEHLEYISELELKYIDLMLKYKQIFPSDSTKQWHQLVLNLMGCANDKCLLTGSSFDEEKMLLAFQENKNNAGIAWIYLEKTILLYLFKDYDRAVTNAKLTEKYQESISGTFTIAIHNFYYSLALLAQYPQVAKNEKKQYLKQVSLNQKKMNKWAYHAPTNFKHKSDLVEAEKARVLGNEVRAIEYYDLAIEGAKKQGYIQEEALANELASQFYFSRGSETIAEVYLTQSYYGYIRWSESQSQRFGRKISRILL